MRSELADGLGADLLNEDFDAITARNRYAMTVLVDGRAFSGRLETGPLQTVPGYSQNPVIPLQAMFTISGEWPFWCH
jgi:hypothetical protein